MPIRIAVLTCLIANLVCTSSGFSQGLTRDQVRTRILDKCVYSEWPTRETKDGIVDDCKCVAQKFAKGLNDDEVSVFDPSARFSTSMKALYSDSANSCR